ncbi:MAG: SusE domain-containing protein [Rikenellaceae bacterium]
MKKILKYISAFSAAAMMVVGCTADFDQAVYDPANATAAAIEDLDANYVLLVDNSADVAITFKWSEPDFGYTAAATNKLEIDVEGKEFAGAATLTSINLGGEYAVTVKDLNSTLLGLLNGYGMEIAATDFQVRVVSSISDYATPLYSNVVSTNITPYDGEMVYPYIAIIGDYSSWTFESSQRIYSPDDDGVYSGMIAFDGKAANGWKISELTGWQGGNWGLDGTGSETAEQSPITLYNDGGSSDMKIYSKGYYNFTFDTASCVLTVNSSYDSWGVVGQYNGWGGSEDTPLTLASEISATGDIDFYLTATVDLVAGEGWKVRPDNTWGNDLGPGAFEGGEPASADGNFYVEESGQYAIRWYFNKVEQRLEAIKLKSSTPALLSSLDASYTLTEATAADVALTLNWSAADLATSEAITNQVEIDIVGKDFATARVLGTTTENSFSMTQEELNAAITALLESYSMDIVEAEVEFRVYSSSSDSSSVPTYSNTVSTKVTPYVKVLAGDDAANDEGYTGPDNSAYAAIVLSGTYNGWEFDNSQRLYSADNDDLYAGMVYLDGLGGDGWKLRADSSWSTSWGLAAADDEAEAATCLLTSDNGGNIALYTGNSYYFTFNTTSQEFTMSKAYATWGIVGSNNSWGGDGLDDAMELACRDNNYYLHATVEFKAGDQWKIRPDNTWSDDLGCSSVIVEDDFKTSDGGNFQIPEDGVYTIRWYFNSVTQEVRVIKHE